MKITWCLMMLSLLWVAGIVSCTSSEPIPTDTPEAHSIIIWSEGKSINVDKGKSIFDELSSEAVRVIKEIVGFAASYSGSEISALEWRRQNMKCLEIKFKEPFPKFNAQDSMVSAFPISAVLFIFREEDRHSVMTYSEDSKIWRLWGSERSNDGLLKMVDEYLRVSIKEFFIELTAGKGSSNVPPGCAEIMIDHISLAYWMDVASVSQEYVIPVYEFSGTCRAANGNLLDNFIGWTEALK